VLWRRTATLGALLVSIQRNEIRILEETKHPYIIRLIDTFEEPDVVQ